MATNTEKFVKGKRFTTDFTFDETNKQVLVKQATTSQSGTARVATPTEAIDGLDNEKMVTPLALNGVSQTLQSNLGALTLSVQDSTSVTLSSVSGTDTLTGVLTPSLQAYKEGQTFRLVVPNANTGAVTLNIDGLGAKDVTKNVSTPLVAGDLLAGAAIQVQYDGIRFQLLSGAGAGGGGGGTTNGAVNNFAQGDLVIAAGTGQVLVGPITFTSLSNAGRLVIL